MNRIKIFSGAALKYIAMITMLLDHFNKALIYPYLNGGVLLIISDIFDILGRIAFPIFCYFVVEGFFKTKNRRKYMLYMLIFGIISEIPFDLFSTGTLFNINCNNIMFTFLLLLIMLCIIDKLKNKLPKFFYIVFSIVIVAVFSLVAMLLGLDYEHHAILSGYFFYLFYKNTLLSIPFCFISMYKQPLSLIGYFLILTYNGERGNQNKIFNYLFYPTHLLILGILRLILNV